MKARRMVGMLFGALVLYILSPGPVFRQYYTPHGIMSARVRAFYSPVFWACQNVPVVENVYQFYFELWLPADRRGVGG